ncbi:energy-coupling factor transporter transmembrane component T family protein [Haloarchaeobius sp. HRN-SO-5]|uniref:energy-coupling factor transporter transmembrane component T family protein n=1 Tax=Haloarchaeobius sp. HRN-SO-5 TaxID=3446118 RepID=UPI003EBAEF61
MLSYAPGDSFAHGLDARSKLTFQVGFAVAVFANPTPRWLAAMVVVAAASLAGARVSPLAVVWSLRLVLAFLALSPLVAAVTVGPPWLVPARAVDSALAVSRVVLVLFVSAAYVRTTPVRATRAAVQRYVPGKAGRLLGAGMALTLRFLPLLRRDLLAVREAMHARGGQRRSVVDRTRRVGLVGLSRAFERADRLSVALRARCFSWNPTPPPASFAPADALVTVAGAALALAGLWWSVAGVLPH